MGKLYSGLKIIGRDMMSMGTLLSKDSNKTGGDSVTVANGGFGKGKLKKKSHKIVRNKEGMMENCRSVGERRGYIFLSQSSDVS